MSADKWMITVEQVKVKDEEEKKSTKDLFDKVCDEW